MTIEVTRPSYLSRNTDQIDDDGGKMKSSTSSRGSSRSVTNILNEAQSVGTLGSGSLSGSGPLTGTASLHNSKMSINSQGSQQSQNSQRPIQEPVDEEPTFLEKAKFYTSLCLGESTE